MPKHKIQSLVTKTADYTATSADENVLVDASSGNITITLPAASVVNNYELTVKRVDSSGNTVTIDGDASETIDGETTQTLAQNDAIKIISDGSNWYVI